MEDRESYLPPVGIGEPMRAGSIGQVTDSAPCRFRRWRSSANYRWLAGLRYRRAKPGAYGPDKATG